jgi:hypothetical protein
MRFDLADSHLSNGVIAYEGSLDAQDKLFLTFKNADGTSIGHDPTVDATALGTFVTPGGFPTGLENKVGRVLQITSELRTFQVSAYYRIHGTILDIHQSDNPPCYCNNTLTDITGGFYFVDRPPTGNFTIAAVKDQPATFTAVELTDPDGSVTSWSWDLNGDGVYGDQPNRTPVTTPTALHGGNYTVGLHIVDDDGTVTNVTHTFAIVGPPTCADLATSLKANGSVPISLSCGGLVGVVLNYEIVSAPAHGVLTAIDQGAGSVTYVPQAGYAGPDSFTYRSTASNLGGGPSNTARVTITVTAPPPWVALAALPGARSTSGAVATLPIVCNGQPSQVCSGSVVAAARERRRAKTVIGVLAAAPKRTVTVTVVVGSVGFAIPGGSQATVRLTLNQIGKQLLAEFHTLPVTLTFTGTTSMTRTITFAYPRVHVHDYWTWACHGSCYSTAKYLTIISLPANARVEARCMGGGCPFVSRRFVPKKGKLDLTSVIAGRRLVPGAVLQITINAPKSIGRKVLIWRMQSGDVPVRTDRCQPPGMRRPIACVG